MELDVADVERYIKLLRQAYVAVQESTYGPGAAIAMDKILTVSFEMMRACASDGPVAKKEKA
jgi:hypothetical protein